MFVVFLQERQQLTAPQGGLRRMITLTIARYDQAAMRAAARDPAGFAQGPRQGGLRRASHGLGIIPRPERAPIQCGAECPSSAKLWDLAAVTCAVATDAKQVLRHHVPAQHPEPSTLSRFQLRSQPNQRDIRTDKLGLRGRTVAARSTKRPLSSQGRLALRHQPLPTPGRGRRPHD